MKNFTKKMIAAFNLSRIAEVTVDVINEAITINRSFYSPEDCLILALNMNRIADVEIAHEAALAINRFRSFSNEERNMYKRLQTESSATDRSPLKRSALNTQSAKIDEAMQEFHSIRELVKLLGYSEARIVSHKRHLERKFSNTVKMIVNPENQKQFKFVKI